MGLKDQLRQCALDAGFDLVGLAPSEPGRDLEFARTWAERGLAGEMDYLANPKRFEPLTVLPGLKSVICVGLIYDTPFPYSVEVQNQAGHRPETPAKGWISRYAWGCDYHKVMREKLEKLRASIEEMSPGAETRVFVDTGPVVERAFARFSGIGWMGKNTCIINEERGSWFFLGVILTTLDLEPDIPAPDRCGSCRACLDACPTGALTEPYKMDATKCISYLTIELRGSIPNELRPGMGMNVFGCDICQDVCPWNRRNQETQVKSKDSGLGIEPSLFSPPLEALAAMTEEEFGETFRHSAIKRAKYRGWLRNLCIAMGNSRGWRFTPKLRQLARHTDPVVREHAEWALKKTRFVDKGCSN